MTGEHRPGEDEVPPFSEAEAASVVEGPVDPELDELDAAAIDAPELETPFEKVIARARRLSDAQVRQVVESILFVASAPLTVDQLYESTGVDRERLSGALSSLAAELAGREAGVVLHEVGDAFQLRTAPQSAELVRRFLKVKPQRLTRAAVETLAIIAYRQPVTRPEIEEIRGVDSGAVVKALLDRRLIKIVGKKDEVGRPILYGTTREFLEFFALKDLNALPTLREFQELSVESQKIVEKEAPSPAEGLVQEQADPSFTERVKAHHAASEQALSELDQAIERAEAEAGKTTALLDEPSASPES